MRKINKVLIANRGEIALRITRTLKDLDIQAIAIYEKSDGDAYYLRFANKAVMIGDEPVKDYLDIEKIIRAAQETGADAIHPGYGFLSESTAFAEACEKAGIIYIGPPPQVISNLGNKVIAREIAERAGLPLIPGTKNLSVGEAGIEEVNKFVQKYGYPIMLKATAGGGGRGIRKLEEKDDLKSQMNQARSEAMLAFNDDRIYVEKLIERAYHIEVQVLADVYGNVVHLGTRDCSIQRRHQKLLEVAPANLPANLLESIHQAAVAIIKESKYVNAGTVEFLVDPQTGEFWFLEVNTRLQVEHTVTEMITGIDIVRRQILIAEGRSLDFRQDQIHINGIAIEVRINAEDPRNNFLPEGGKHIDIYNPPGGPGIRLDGAIYRGYRIPIAYDSLLVKLIVWGYEWEQTINRLKRALMDFVITGPYTTIPMYLSICDEQDFKKRKFDTGYVENHPGIFDYPRYDHYVIDEQVYKALAEETAKSRPDQGVKQEELIALKEKKHLTSDEIGTLKKAGIIRSPIKGKISKVVLDIGDVVLAGDFLIDLEAMKMHTHIISEVDGRISDIMVEPGDTVDVGDALMFIEVG
ncbi:MAG: pyruvate carboxylase subunit A [Syntrophus sp. SKADARSKE-3]|nr:pyruvate carboxylase subunit A [Syntrophus sp. SKADARSKE-3]